jgi:electron transfer flavoprotein beta subunit
MGWPQLTSVLKIDEIDFEKRFVVVERLVEGGREVVRAQLPAVLTCTRELNMSRYAAFPDMVRAARYQPIAWDKVALGIADDDPNIGLRGSPTIVSKVWAPAPRQRPGAQWIKGDDPSEAAKELGDVLANLGFGASGRRASEPETARS